MIDAACEAAVSSLHCSCGSVTLAAALAYGLHCRCGMATCLPAWNISMPPPQLTLAAAKRPLAWALGAHSGPCSLHGPFAMRRLDGEQRASADVCHIHANSISLARLLVRPWKADAPTTTVIRGA